MAIPPAISIAVALEIRIAFFMSIFLMFQFRETVCSFRLSCSFNSYLSLNFVRTGENCRKLYQSRLSIQRGRRKRNGRTGWHQE